MRRNRQAYVIRSVRQLHALRTPTRQRILDALQESRRSSVKELAEKLRCKPESLYYHLSQLAEVGLAMEVGRRHTGKREEALYRAAAQEVVVDHENRSPEFLDALLDMYRSILRANARELERALVAERRETGPRRNTGLIQQTVRMSRTKQEVLRAKLQDIRHFVAENEDPKASEAFSLTISWAKLTDVN